MNPLIGSISEPMYSDRGLGGGKQRLIILISKPEISDPNWLVDRLKRGTKGGKYYTFVVIVKLGTSRDPIMSWFC
jgi:hypothetical protein